MSINVIFMRKFLNILYTKAKNFKFYNSEKNIACQDRPPAIDSYASIWAAIAHMKRSLPAFPSPSSSEEGQWRVDPEDNSR